MKTIADLEMTRRHLLLLGVTATMTAAFIDRADAATMKFSHILGRPTDRSIALSVLASSASSAYVEYGLATTKVAGKTKVLKLSAATPLVFELSGLQSSSRYFYRLRYKAPGSSKYAAGVWHSFSTAKSAGNAFSFTVHGDTHPERAGKMFNAALYAVTLRNVLQQQPDFHILMGDDFSIDPLISKKQATKANVEKVYATHRNWLAAAGASVPIYLVNGNHEQAAAYLLDGSASSPAVLAANARLKYFPLPTTNDFYTADKTKVANVGELRDYYSWSWGDATFITLDPYWHSSKAVDNVAGVTVDSTGGKKGAGKTSNLWQVGIGDEQYAWFKQVLETSTSKYIFVFAHHVLGTGRGAVEISYNYEWGGKDPSGKTTFAEQRPNWELPIHDLMVKHGVSIFFQGHDHIFVTQERDGVIYQAMPNPADDTFTMFNDDAYKSGVKSPNSGHVRVSVEQDQAIVEYFLAARPTDTARKNLEIAHTYVVKPRTLS